MAVRWLTMRQVCRLYGVEHPTVTRWLQKKLVHGFKMTGKWFIADPGQEYAEALGNQKLMLRYLPILGPKEVRELTGRSRRTLRDWIAIDRLRGIRLPGKQHEWRHSVNDLDRALHWKGPKKKQGGKRPSTRGKIVEWARKELTAMEMERGNHPGVHPYMRSLPEAEAISPQTVLQQQREREKRSASAARPESRPHSPDGVDGKD